MASQQQTCAPLNSSDCDCTQALLIDSCHTVEHVFISIQRLMAGTFTEGCSPSRERRWPAAIRATC